MWSLSKSGRIERLVAFKYMDGGYVPVGLLIFEGNADRRQGRFAYAESYLARHSGRPIDPVGLPLRRKWQVAAPEEVQLAFHDCGPDGWGKGILDMAFPGLRLGMPEYLALGTLKRTGDLAFGPTPEDGPQTWTPGEEPLLSLPDETDDLEALCAAAQAVEEGDASRSHLALLARASPDVGGARPKARLRHKGSDWIAKFPAWGDKFDDPRMEAICLDVAQAAGIETPERELITVGKRTVLMVRRFDRSVAGDALAYLSAGTLLGEPATSYGTTKTYADIAEVGRRIGARGAAEDMFRRFLLNSFLHNTDDHLRNHAFINEGGAWRLAPVFDVVPTLGRDRHVCAPAAGVSPAWDPTSAFGAHEGLRIRTTDAQAILDEVLGAMGRLDEFMEARQLAKGDRDVVNAALASKGRPAWARAVASTDETVSIDAAAIGSLVPSDGPGHGDGPETWLRVIVTRGELDAVIESRKAGQMLAGRGDVSTAIVRLLVEAGDAIRFQTFVNEDGTPVISGDEAVRALRRGFGSGDHRSIQISEREVVRTSPEIGDRWIDLRTAALDVSGRRRGGHPKNEERTEALER